MRWYEEFRATGHTFRERVGRPDSFTSALGRIAINFSGLEDSVTIGIRRLLATDEITGEIVAAELSFRTKLNIYGALYRHAATRYEPATRDGILEKLDETLRLCSKAEELRNQIMHSSWIHTYARKDRVDRRKVTAKAKRGHHVQLERISSGYLLDIADYIVYATFGIEEMTSTLNEPEFKEGLMPERRG